MTAGQASECGQANALTESFPANSLLADRGYNSDAFALQIKKSGAEPVTPPKGNRVAPRDYNKEIDKERNRVERLSQTLKDYRCIATRDERLLCNYMGMIQVAAIMIWLA